MKFTFDRPIIQGDVVLKRLKDLPKGAIKTKTDVKVLQMSEVTGHHHHFRGNAAVDLYQLEMPAEEGASTITPNEGKFIVVREESTLYHGKSFDDQPAAKGTGDHNSAVIAPGTYFVDIVREYDYDKMEESRVID